MENEASVPAAPGDPGDDPVRVPMPKSDEDTDEEEEPTPEALSFCELCGASEDDDDELLRCEECGRLHCTNCRVYDEEGTPFCEECADMIPGVSSEDEEED